MLALRKLKTLNQWVGGPKSKVSRLNLLSLQNSKILVKTKQKNLQRLSSLCWIQLYYRFWVPLFPFFPFQTSYKPSQLTPPFTAHNNYINKTLSVPQFSLTLSSKVCFVLISHHFKFLGFSQNSLFWSHFSVFLFF